MENFLTTLAEINDKINAFIWVKIGLVLLIGTGILMTCCTKWFQISHIGYWWQQTIGGMFRRDSGVHAKTDKKTISQFQALCTALAATIGTGNIAGVSAAIVIGGPGAVFWMWLAAFFGMMTNFSENVLGIYYRRRNSQGEWSGGAMYYLKDGLGGKKHCKTIGSVLAVLFSIFAILASFGIGNMGQINKIVLNMKSAFFGGVTATVGGMSVVSLACGIVLMILAALIVIGGLQRIATDHIQQTEQGGLIVGLAGERVINSFKFYGVFQESEEYTVRSESQELGTVVSPPPVGEKLAIAGHVWQVLDVDHKRRLIYCQQVKGSVPAYFGQCPGDLHTKILTRMRRVLQEDRQYPYLMKNAVARLEQARFTAAHSGAAEKTLINLGGNMWCLLPWVGTYTFLTMERFLKIKCADRLGLRNLDSARPFFIQFTMKADEETFFRVLAEEIRKPIDPMELVYPKELPLFDKYDEYLPEELVKKGFALGVLDVDGLREKVLSWEN